MSPDRLAVGPHGALTTEQARALAQQALAAVARGEDPQAERRAGRTAATMAELWKRYESDHLPRKKPSSQQNDRQMWRDYVAPALGRRLVADVTANDVDRLHRNLAAKPHTANRVVALLSKMSALAERWGMRPDGVNPCRHIEKYREEARQRYLTTAELDRLGDALRQGLAIQAETPHMVAAIQLLLLTGARLNELLTARWEWVELERRVILLPDSKTGAKPLFLSEAAVTVLVGLRALPISTESPFIIRGRRADQPLVNLAKPWKRICARAGIRGVRLHDLRHTAASVAVGQGASLPIIGRLLGHTQSSTTNRYAHVAIDPALAAVDSLGRALASIYQQKQLPATDESGDA